MTDDILKQPLEFGNAQQIDAIKQADRMAEFNALPNCEECNGNGLCFNCRSDCPKCDGLGKEIDAYDKFKEKYPMFQLRG